MYFKKFVKNFFLRKGVYLLKNKWVLQVFIISFILSALFSGLSTYVSDFNVILLIVILLLVIMIGIIFDMIGVAVLTADEAPFHARNSKKVKSAASCIKLLKNSAKVSSVCNDIVGDICGIISGALGASLVAYITLKFNINVILVTILVTSFISALTVGGKACFKILATKKSDSIVFLVGKIIHIFHF